MPIRITAKSGAGKDYGNPFLGPGDHTVGLDVDLSNLTNKEIDTKGYLKAGIPLTDQGALLATAVKSTAAAAVAGGGNGGNGTVGSISGGYYTPTETITLTCITVAANGGTFRVEGDKSGVIGTATVGTPFVSPVINLTIADGANDFELLDSFTIAVTAGASSKIYGITVEPFSVAADNAAGTIAALGTIEVAVALEGVVVKDAAEDMLERSYTAAEVAGFTNAGSKFSLIA